jgi:hypothetical protein
MLAARLVGPSGEVVGIERDAGSIAVARARLAEAGFRNVSFTQTDASQIVSHRPFDAAVGRFILMFIRIPQRCYVRWLDWFVRAGCWPFRSRRGLLFLLSLRRCRFGPRWFHRFEVFARSGVHTEIGPDLYRIFQEIGLPAPNVFIETPLGSDPASTRVVCEVLASLRPLAQQHKVSLDAVGDFGTLPDRVQAEVAASRTSVSWVPLVGAWVRKPI